jgi:uncharacterized protein YceK
MTMSASVSESVWRSPAVACCVLYALSVALSRLYLGVHSLLDVGGGLLLGTLLLALLHRHGDAVDRIYTHPTPGTVVACFIIAGGVLGVYPRPAPWSVSYLTACTVVGTWVGLALALWWVHARGNEVLGVFRGWGARAQEYALVYSQVGCVGEVVSLFVCVILSGCCAVTVSRAHKNLRQVACQSFPIFF